MLLITVQPRPDLDQYELVKPVIIDGIFIDAGFLFDGASVPKALWPIIGSPFQPKFMAPALVHDFLYSQGSASGYTRLQADRIFFKLLLANGVDLERAKTMFTGVRIGGGSHWKTA